MNAMKKTGVLAALFCTVVLAATAFGAPWQNWRGSGGWGANGAYQRLYNPTTVETITGIVEAVDKVTPMRGMNYGVHLVVKAGDQDVSVHLGPGWYIERLDTKIVKGDQVEIKGSRIMVKGKPVLIAAEVKKGESTLKLRDDNGVPVWAGWRR
ncbi:hypothetical protein GURASL_24820 [Geotalea uraniireducens]|uniref:Magnetosome protein MamS/MamX domain-containing protein n=1 Tax=Geotalea uraniireducens TaxID=351604 RepID=A0ABM8EMA0_9BACT|nr:DNA-binding protein [Geotalea uraniireducens]BDV43559.1 hypothetical protein GURASL_24820 [Geotalea uraniireducens]